MALDLPCSSLININVNKSVCSVAYSWYQRFKDENLPELFQFVPPSTHISFRLPPHPMFSWYWQQILMEKIGESDWIPSPIYPWHMLTTLTWLIEILLTDCISEWKWCTKKPRRIMNTYTVILIVPLNMPDLLLPTGFYVPVCWMCIWLNMKTLTNNNNCLWCWINLRLYFNWPSHITRSVVRFHATVLLTTLGFILRAFSTGIICSLTTSLHIFNYQYHDPLIRINLLIQVPYSWKSKWPSELQCTNAFHTLLSITT